MPYYWRVTSATDVHSSETCHWQDLAVQQSVDGEALWLARDYFWEIEARMGGRKYVLSAPSHHTRFYCSMRSRIPLYGRTEHIEHLYFVIGMIEPGQTKTWLEIDRYGNANIRQCDLREAARA